MISFSALSSRTSSPDSNLENAFGTALDLDAIGDPRLAEVAKEIAAASGKSNPKKVDLSWVAKTIADIDANPSHALASCRADVQRLHDFLQFGRGDAQMVYRALVPGGSKRWSPVYRLNSLKTELRTSRSVEQRAEAYRRLFAGRVGADLVFLADKNSQDLFVATRPAGTLDGLTKGGAISVIDLHGEPVHDLVVVDTSDPKNSLSEVASGTLEQILDAIEDGKVDAPGGKPRGVADMAKDLFGELMSVRTLVPVAVGAAAALSVSVVPDSTLLPPDVKPIIDDVLPYLRGLAALVGSAASRAAVSAALESFRVFKLGSNVAAVRQHAGLT
ncbi:MAG: hypothetical protein AAF658_06560, partial [Myxococcota bacterium]